MADRLTRFNEAQPLGLGGGRQLGLGAPNIQTASMRPSLSGWVEAPMEADPWLTD